MGTTEKLSLLIQFEETGQGKFQRNKINQESSNSWRMKENLSTPKTDLNYSFHQFWEQIKFYFGGSRQLLTQLILALPRLLTISSGTFLVIRGSFFKSILKELVAIYTMSYFWNKERVLFLKAYCNMPQVDQQVQPPLYTRSRILLACFLLNCDLL